MNSWHRGIKFMKSIERYHIEKYYKEYKCNYQYEEVTYDWNTIGKRDLYKCPECIYQGTKEKCCGEGY